MLSQLRGVKADTGIVGLQALPNAREVLREKLTDVLQAVSEQVPEQAEYRKAVEATMNYRLKAVDSEASDEEVEEQFTMQLEQLIKQCEDELGLIPKMAEWKPWDVPADHKVSMHMEEFVDDASRQDKPK
ncbi:hypothetical protein CVIRNUC_005671 [Coccomyxa viridis]|uniref:Uncharacterized protein n=1 Tax=Coccomyxa viridis TaxID=1274662 RepID=A0AAV1I528_9CHLO|nr:hypothetical protein CVIRNUC_005671 [Coccomyxa viridis]